MKAIKSIGHGISSAFKSVGHAISKFAKSKIGKAIIMIAAVYFTAGMAAGAFPAIAEGVGAAATAVSEGATTAWGAVGEMVGSAATDAAGSEVASVAGEEVGGEIAGDVAANAAEEGAALPTVDAATSGVASTAADSDGLVTQAMSEGPVQAPPGAPGNAAADGSVLNPSSAPASPAPPSAAPPNPAPSPITPGEQPPSAGLEGNEGGVQGGDLQAGSDASNGTTSASGGPTRTRSILDWYANLSRGGQMAVGQAIAGGGSAAVNAIAASEQQRAVRQAEIDRQRRNAIPDMTGLYQRSGLVRNAINGG